MAFGDFAGMGTGQLAVVGDEHVVSLLPVTCDPG